jgi:hypothetical protein
LREADSCQLAAASAKLQAAGSTFLQIPLSKIRARAIIEIHLGVERFGSPVRNLGFAVSACATPAKSCGIGKKALPISPAHAQDKDAQGFRRRVMPLRNQGRLAFLRLA